MSQVFLAYRSVDAERANTVRTKLEALGVPLFIDHKLISGDDYIRVINEQLDAAVAVLVLWTAAAVDMSSPSGAANFVLSEAERGFSRGILVAATFDKLVLSHLPVPFNRFQAPDVSDWIANGASAKHQGWQSVLKALGNKLGRPGLADLAVALESTDEILKKKFLHDYPSDPSSQKIATDLEAFERSEFDARVSAARKRIQQRVKEAEKRLKLCRDEFEAQVVELRAGRDFMAPDPVKALDDNVAKLSNQITIDEGTIEELRTRAEKAEAALSELAALKSAVAGSAVAKEESARTADMQVNQQDTAAASFGGAKADTRRSLAWSAAAVIIVACVFGTGGWLLAQNPGNQPIEDAHALQTQVATLSAQLKKSQTQSADLERNNNDLQQRESKISAQEASLANDKAELDKRAASLKAQDDSLSAQRAELEARTADLDRRTNDVQRRESQVSAQETALANLRDELDKRAATLAAQQNALPAQKTALEQQAAAPSIPFTAQCDLLAGYQHDPDRPEHNGFARSIQDDAAARAACESALQSANDRITQRRMLLELGRAVEGSDPKKALEFWQQAADRGSSDANYVLGKYYADHLEAKTAWDYYTKAANMNPPDPLALYWVAYNLLIRDGENVLQPTPADPAEGEKYLRLALNADFAPAYYIAGVHYWQKNKTEKNRADQNKDIELATRYLTTSWCVKRDADAAKFYLKQKNQALSCE
jgi:TIR domain